jgi:PAS domain S-box-containing protein
MLRTTFRVAEDNPLDKLISDLKKEGHMIVAVDDDPECLSTLTGILRSEGFGVRVAMNGPGGLAAIADNPPELILLDTQMPGLDGFEVCRRIKENEKTRQIPVVFLSVATETEERAQGLRMGAADFVSKPLVKEELLVRVRTQLELNRLRQDMEKRVVERTTELLAAKAVLEEELASRSRHEEHLRERENWFRELVDRAPLGVWVMAPDQRLLLHNKRGLKVGGRAMHQLSGDEWTRIVHPDDLNQVKSQFAVAVNERRGFRIAYRILGANGRVRWVLNTGIPRFLGDAFVGHIGTTIDITNLWRGHERAMLAEKVDSLECLTAGISHDFNNLMGTILTAAELALADLPMDSPARQNIERIGAVADRASEIVSMLMTYARSYGARPDRLDLSLVVAEIIELLRGKATPKIVLNVNLAPGLPEIHANVTQIRQVILNLVMNAFESLEGAQGNILVATDWLFFGQGNPEREMPAGEYCRLLVADTGCGMTPDESGKVFDPFYSTKFIGRGLGLSVVHGIVRSLGGIINVYTAPAKGSTFEILLPCAARVPANGFRKKTAGQSAR